MSNPLEPCPGDNKPGREALEAISSAIDPTAYDGLMEIELLGQTLFPPQVWVLRDGPAIAINKVGLRAAYIEALKDLVRVHDVGLPPEYDRVAERLNSLALLILLSPEHLLAINRRKELLLSVLVEDGADLARYRRLAQFEQRFVDSLLTSPLNQHNKSPTIWAHRRWLVPFIVRFGVFDVLRDLKQVVMVAGERHPRNYYAWHHARYLMTLVDWSAESPKADLLRTVVEWCIRHHDDTSGWSFLQSLLLAEGRYDPTTISDIFNEIIRLAGHLHWTNESVWVFLRTMAVSNVMDEADYLECCRTINGLRGSANDDTAKRVLQAAAAWCVDYHKSPVGVET